MPRVTYEHTTRESATSDRRSQVVGGVAVVFGVFAAILGSGFLALTIAYEVLFLPEIARTGEGGDLSRFRTDSILMIHTPIWMAGGLALGLCGAALRARDTRTRRTALMAVIVAAGLELLAYAVHQIIMSAHSNHDQRPLDIAGIVVVLGVGEAALCWLLVLLRRLPRSCVPGASSESEQS